MSSSDHDLYKAQGLIAVGIPSFQRPAGLRKCLDSISRQQHSLRDEDIVVIVAENDLFNAEALQVVGELAPSYRFRLYGVKSAARGISDARNALLSQGFDVLGASALVMIDDDQWIDTNWLQNMVSTWKTTAADAVGSYVVPDFMDAAPTWVHKLPVFHRKAYATGPIANLVGTGGVLISAKALHRLKNPKFDPSYAFTGGGDTEFFLRLKESCGTFAFCAEAVTYECYPEERQTLSWVRRRAERYGMSNMIIRLNHNTSKSFLLVQMFKTCFGLTKGLLLAVLFAFHREKREKAFRVLFRARGQLRAIFGDRFETYR